MTALTQKNSGRLLAVALTIGVALALALIALRPAGAETIQPIPANVGDVCDLIGDDSTAFVGETFTFEIPQGSDPTRVFTETYDLVDGATIAVEVPTNRKDLTFTVTDAKVIGFAVFDKTNLRSGQFYDYSPDGTLTGTVSTPDGVERNIKGATVCYKTKADPTLSTVGIPGAQGEFNMKNTATLAGGDAPTGTIAWTAYSDSSCTTSVGTDSTPVSGNGDYTTPVGVAGNAGTYYWIATYSGDSNNNGASSPCGAETTIYLNTIQCGETFTAVVEGVAGDIASRVEATRSEIPGKTTCSAYPAIPYELSITPTVVSLDYPTTGPYADGARFLVKIDWAGDVDSNNPPDREVDYLLNGVFVTGPECPSSNQPNDVFPSIAYTYAHPTTTAYPDGVPVCKAGEYLVPLGSGTWQQIQWWDTIFDPQWR